MSEYITTFTEYTPRTIERNDGSGSFVLHKFKDTNGTEMVARGDVANLVRGYLHQPLRVTVRTEQKGQWTNHYLDHAEPAHNGAQGQPQAPAQYQGQVQAPPRPTPPPTPPPPPLPAPPETLTEKDKQIHRQVAAKVAANISTTASEFWQNCIDLAFYFDYAQTPQNPAQFQQAQPDRQYTDDDIPF